MNKLSVIIPVYNAEKWLTETLESVFAQTYPNIEIICVDDGSKDNSCEIIAHMQTNHPNLRLIKQENAGVCAARNAGIEATTGTYVAFLDADDLLEPVAYEQMIAQLEREQSDIVFCSFVRFWPSGKKQYTVEESFPALIKNPQDIKYFFYSVESRVDGDTLYTKDIHGSSCRSIYKRDIFIDHAIRFHTDLRFAEDQVFVLEYLAHANKISYIGKPFLWYRGHTKPWVYHDFYQNHMNLLKYQLQVLEQNTFYTSKEKKQMCGYLKCSTYFMIISQEFMFKRDADKRMHELTKNKEFRRLLTTYNFIQKYKVRPDPRRIALFALLKMRCFRLTKKFWTNKKY